MTRKDWKTIVILFIGLAIIATLATRKAHGEDFGYDWFPTAITVEAEHVSHVSQHFGSNQTNYGFDSIALALRWDYKRFHLELSDGVVLEACTVYNQCGGLVGPREVARAKVGFDLWRR